MSWEIPVQGLTKQDNVIPSSKSKITVRPFRFVSTTTKLLLVSLAKLPYALFKLGYEIAKLVTKRLSSLRRLLFMRK